MGAGNAEVEGSGPERRIPLIAGGHQGCEVEDPTPAALAIEVALELT